MEYEVVCRVLVQDDQDAPAVKRNARAVAHMLGYVDGPESTPVKRIRILHADSVREFVVEEGVYASATCAHAACFVRYQGFLSCTWATQRVMEVPIDDRFIHFIRHYMGARVMIEAEDPRGTKHAFVRSVLGAEGGKLFVFLR